MPHICKDSKKNQKHYSLKNHKGALSISCRADQNQMSPQNYKKTKNKKISQARFLN